MSSTFVKGFMLVALLTFSATFAFSQDEYNKVEGFGGYSYMNLDRAVELDQFINSNQNRVNSHGFNGSLTYNFRRFWGAKFDVSLHSHGEDFQGIITTNPPPPTPPPTQTFKVSQNDYQYMGGIQFKDNSKDGPKFKPFGHVLLGVSDSHFSIDQETGTANGSAFRVADVNSTDFAMKFGGGVDLRAGKNIDIRVFQFDFNPIWRGKTDFGPNFGVSDGAVRSNYMITFGIAFH